ncbi:MAG: hypothetical protein JXA11_04685 [Phycisphaerae bacterium]|nr:hypothetical protein [Phycisphaerae bacterium]
MKRVYRFAWLTILLTILPPGFVSAQMKLMHIPAADPAAGGESGTFPKGLLLSGGKTMHGTFQCNDTQGGMWGIYLNQGFIQQSTNNVYANGLYLHVQGNNFYTRNNQGLVSASGDEVQIGPWDHQQLRVYRRVKIFKKEGIARFMDVYHNTGPAKRVDIRMQTYLNYGISSLLTNDGKNSFSEKSFAFVTTTNNNPQIPGTLHVVCGPRSKLRPSVTQQGNRFDVNYNFTIPAGGTMVLVDFEAQRVSGDKLMSLMKNFKPQKFLKDLPVRVRRLIANVGAVGGPEDMDLDRHESLDRVVLRDGQEYLGTVSLPKFRMTTARGDLELPSERVVGMVAWGAAEGQMRALLTDGQIVTGDVGEQTLPVEIPTVGKQVIPLADIQAWSYRVSKERPDELTDQGPYLRLRTGDRLRFQPESVSLALQTRDGVVTLAPADLQDVLLDNPEHNLHRVRFRNGSELSGLLLPESIEPELNLGAKQTLPRELLERFEYAAEEIPDAEKLPTLTLADGDVLRGRFDGKEILLKGKYGQMTLQSDNIRELTSIPERTGWFRATLWNGSIVQGRLETPRLTFRLQPGPAVELTTARIASFDQPNVLPPQEIIQGVAELVVQLGAESYQDRKTAQEKLIQMGPGIAPILKKHLNHKDPEIRQRIRDILDQITAVG